MTAQGDFYPWLVTVAGSHKKCDAATVTGQRGHSSGAIAGYNDTGQL